jgi:hypothetical protein
MKKFFRSFSRLTPHFIALLMVLVAASGHFLTGTISLFEFWTLLGLSQIISILGTFSDAIEVKEESNKENTQINS